MLPPIMAISGFSGSGKTTLIEALLPRLAARGLRVGVIKHDAHRLEFDREGKDTWRARKAGAARVEAFDSAQWFQIAAAPTPPIDIGRDLPPAHRDDLDLILVEGGKGSDIDKVWLLSSGEDGPPRGVTRVLAVLGRDCDRPAVAEPLIAGWLARAFRDRPRAVALLAGASSASTAAGPVPLRLAVETAREFSPVVVVAGALPPAHALTPGVVSLPCVPGVESPLGCMLAAMRWDPDRTWVFVPADLPSLCPELLAWLWDQRAPGTWSVQCVDRHGSPIPLLRVQEPGSLSLSNHPVDPTGCKTKRSVWIHHPTDPASQLQ